jgi:hypothetical protein
MLTPRQARLAFVPVMVTLMSCVMSLTITTLHFGLRPGLLEAWLSNWALAFVVALPLAWVIVPAVRAGLARVTSDEAPAESLVESAAESPRHHGRRGAMG